MIVYFGGVPYDGVAGTDRHLAEELSTLVPVLYVDPPISFLTPLRRPELAGSMRGSPIRQEGDRLWRLVPRVLPGAHRAFMEPVTAALQRRAVRQALATLGQRPSAVVANIYEDVLGCAPGARTLFHATDDLVAGAELMGMSRRRLAAGRARQLARADVVAVVSPVLQEQFRALGRRSVVLPNGCTPSAYDQVGSLPWPEDVPRFEKPVAGFVGNINARIDLGLLEAVADAGHPLLLVGPHHRPFEPERFRALVSRPGVCWTGRKPFVELPRYLGVIRVGLTPYAMDDFNRASCPIKTLEYLAAGRGVVSTPVPATVELGGPVRIAGSIADFAAAVTSELMIDPAEEQVAGRRAFAREHSWAVRARTLAELLDIHPNLEVQ